MGQLLSRGEASAQPSCCSRSEGSAPPTGVQTSSLDPTATPWLSAATRGAHNYNRTVSDPAAGDSLAGLVQVARRRHRKRGSRGRGALARRKRDRPRLVAAADVGQRAAQRRSSSDSRLCDILVAIQAQGAAIESLAASVGRLAGAVHAQQRRRADSPPQRESGVENSQPPISQELVEHISQQLVQVQHSVQQTAEAQQRSQQRVDRFEVELRATRNDVLELGLSRQQVSQQVSTLERQLDALQQSVGATRLDRSRALTVNAIGHGDDISRRVGQLEEATYNDIGDRVVTLEQKVGALSSNLDHFLGPFSR